MKRINEILYNNENKGTTCKNMDDSHKYNAEWKNPDTQEYVSYDCSCEVQI